MLSPDSFCMRISIVSLANYCLEIFAVNRVGFFVFMYLQMDVFLIFTLGNVRCQTMFCFPVLRRWIGVALCATDWCRTLFD